MPLILHLAKLTTRHAQPADEDGADNDGDDAPAAEEADTPAETDADPDTGNKR